MFRAILRNHLAVRFVVEPEQESDRRWIAEIPQIPGAMAYGATQAEAVTRVQALGLRVLAERKTADLIGKPFPKRDIRRMPKVEGDSTDYLS